MEQKVWLYWTAQICGWSAYYVFSFLLLSATFRIDINLFLWVGICIAFSVFISHAMRWVILRFDFLGLNLPALLFYTIVISFFAAFCLEFFQFFLDTNIPIDFIGNENDEPFNWAIFFLATSRSVILFLLWCGFYYAFVIIEKSRSQELLNLQWQASKNEIELKNLRAQLNPHFLFNSLNSIRALVGINPEQAKLSITQLSALLRTSIQLGKQKVIPLKDELELVDHYLKLEQIRFEERLTVNSFVDENALNCMIPPLMVQTIVENGIKHGIAQSIEGGQINIKAKFENKILNIDIENTGQLKERLSENGVGISNTKKRLTILFGDETSFDLKQEGDLVKASIKIKYA